MRLRDLWADPPGLLTHRELVNLISYLPPEAATVRLVFGRDAPWTPEMHRLTDIADTLDRANWQRTAKPGQRSPKSKYRRPRPPLVDDEDEDLEDDEDPGEA